MSGMNQLRGLPRTDRGPGQLAKQSDGLHFRGPLVASRPAAIGEASHEEKDQGAGDGRKL